MIFDEDGLLEEPCLSCDEPYIENIWNEWHCDCDEEECPHRSDKMTQELEQLWRAESEGKMKELIHAHDAKLLADNINHKEIYDIKIAITCEIMKLVNKGQYKTTIFFENKINKYKDEIIEWLKSKEYKVEYDPGNQMDGPVLNISWEGKE